MRVLLLSALLAIPASGASPATDSAPLFSEPVNPVPVVSVPGLEKPAINPNPRAALGICPPTAAQMAVDRMRKAHGGDLFHKLTELPPADAYVAVYRRDPNGCEDPIVIKYRIGDTDP